MERIPQSVALRVPLKVFLASDSKSPATGKTVAVVISKNGGAFGNPSAGATNATEVSLGWYYVDLSTTDTGTQGPLIVRGTNADSDPSEARYDVVDAYNAGLSALPTGALPTDAGGSRDVHRINGQLTSAAAGITFPASIANQTSVDGLEADTAALIAALAVVDGNVDDIELLVAATAIRSALGLGAANLDTQLADLPTVAEFEARTIAAASYATAAELAKVPKSDGTASWNATALAALQNEANDALVALKLDRLVAVADADDPVDNSIIAKLASKGATADWSTFVNTDDSLQAIRDQGDSAWGTGIIPTAENIADAVWDEANAAHVAAGSTGKALADALADTNELQQDWTNNGRLDVILDARASQASVDNVDSDLAVVAAALAVVDGNVDDIETIVTTTGVHLTAAGIDAVWDDAITEPAGRPAWASMTPRKIQQTLGVLMLNEIDSDSDSVNVRNDADSADLWAYPSSDDGTTFISGEAA